MSFGRRSTRPLHRWRSGTALPAREPGPFADSTPRIAVVGDTCSGKTTLSRQLSLALGIPHVELDALHWEPNWTMAETDVFRKRVGEALKGDRWLADGNYSKVRDLIWPRATTLIWLDYPLGIIVWRVLWRTLVRSITKEELWNGNREGFRAGFLSRDSLLVWAVETHRRRRRRYAALLARPEYSHLMVVRLRSPRATREWLSGVLPSQPVR